MQVYGLVAAAHGGSVSDGIGLFKYSNVMAAAVNQMLQSISDNLIFVRTRPMDIVICPESQLCTVDELMRCCVFIVYTYTCKFSVTQSYTFLDLLQYYKGRVDKLKTLVTDNNEMMRNIILMVGPLGCCDKLSIVRLIDHFINVKMYVLVFATVG